MPQPCANNTPSRRAKKYFDALISRRVYKEVFPHQQAAVIMSEGRGSHFDPDMLDAFLRSEAEFRAIARQFSDNND